MDSEGSDALLFMHTCYCISYIIFFTFICTLTWVFKTHEVLTRVVDVVSLDASRGDVRRMKR